MNLDVLFLKRSFGHISQKWPKHTTAEELRISTACASLLVCRHDCVSVALHYLACLPTGCHKARQVARAAAVMLWRHYLECCARLPCSHLPGPLPLLCLAAGQCGISLTTCRDVSSPGLNVFVSVVFQSHASRDQVLARCVQWQSTVSWLVW